MCDQEECTCLEVFGEDPDCSLHGAAAVVKQLRNLAAGKHDDLSVADDAADLIEELMDKIGLRTMYRQALLGHVATNNEPTDASDDMVRAAQRIFIEQSDWRPSNDMVRAALEAALSAMWRKGEVAARVSSACLSYRHDYGLLPPAEQERLRFEAKEWLNAWRKELSPLPAPPVKE